MRYELSLDTRRDLLSRYFTYADPSQGSHRNGPEGFGARSGFAIFSTRSRARCASRKKGFQISTISLE